LTAHGVRIRRVPADDVVKITAYVASNERAGLVAAWRVVHDCFGPHEPPASVLAHPDQLFEVEAAAVRSGGKKFRVSVEFGPRRSYRG